MGRVVPISAAGPLTEAPAGTLAEAAEAPDRPSSGPLAEAAETIAAKHRLRTALEASQATAEPKDILQATPSAWGGRPSERRWTAVATAEPLAKRWAAVATAEPFGAARLRKHILRLAAALEASQATAEPKDILQATPSAWGACSPTRRPSERRWAAVATAEPLAKHILCLAAERCSAAAPCSPTRRPSASAASAPSTGAEPAGAAASSTDAAPAGAPAAAPAMSQPPAMPADDATATAAAQAGGLTQRHPAADQRHMSAEATAVLRPSVPASPAAQCRPLAERRAALSVVRPGVWAR